MENRRTHESRLRDLVESEKYKDEFNKVKERILSNPGGCFRSIRLINLGFEDLKQLGPRAYHKRYPLTFSYPQIKELFEKGNINEHWIFIPEKYSDFRRRWSLFCFFDPFQKYPDGFNPFRYVPPAVPMSPIFRVKNFFRDKIWEFYDPADLVCRPRTVNRLDQSDDDRLMFLEIDTSLKTQEIIARVGKEIRNHKKAYHIRDRKKDRYSDEKISQIRILLNKGHNRSEVLKILYPEFKNFKYMKYITKVRPNSRDKKAVRLYRGICRVAKRIKERET